MLLIVILAVFLVPMASIMTIPGTIIWYPQLLALQFIGGLFFASMFWKLNKFLALLLAYLSFSYVYITSANPRTLLCLMIGYMAISITLGVSRIKSTKNIYIALSIMAFISIAFSILQSFKIDPIFVTTDIISFMGSRNQLGIYSCASAFWNPFLIPLSFIPVILAKSNSGFMGLVAGGLVYSYFRFTKQVFTLFAMIAALLFVPFFVFSGKGKAELMERIDLWKLSISQTLTGTSQINMDAFTDPKSTFYTNYRTIKCNPWFGYGLGNFFSYSNRTQRDILYEYKMNLPIGHVYEHAHNDLVEAFYEFGKVGFVLVLGTIFSVVVSFVRSYKTFNLVVTFSSLVAQSVASCSVYVFHAPVSLFMICLTLGLFYREVAYAKQSKIEPDSEETSEGSKTFRWNDRRRNLSEGFNYKIPEGNVLA